MLLWLILEIASLDGVVKFSFAGLEISSRIDGLILPPSGTDLGKTFEEYKNEEDILIKNLIKNSEAQGFPMTISREPDIELSW